MLVTPNFNFIHWLFQYVLSHLLFKEHCSAILEAPLFVLNMIQMITFNQKPFNQPPTEIRCAKVGKHLKHAGQRILRSSVEEHRFK